MAKRFLEHEDTNGRGHDRHKTYASVAQDRHGLRGYGLVIGEVISEGNVGLMQGGEEKFDPERGFRLGHTTPFGMDQGLRSRNTILRSVEPYVKDGHHRQPQKPAVYSTWRARSRADIQAVG